MIRTTKGKPYANIAMQFAEVNRITNFKVNGNIMTYYKNGYKDINRKQAFSVKFDVNLDTMEVKTTPLKRVTEQGWDNV